MGILYMGNYIKWKEKKKFSQAYHTKKEALLAEREYAANLNGIVDDKSMTFKELYTAYYEYQKEFVKATTLKTYRDRIKYMQMLDNVKLVDLNITHYERWRKEISKLTNISTSYKNQIQKFIKIVLNWGSKQYGYDFRRFYTKITNFVNPNEIKKEMDYYTLDEFKQFISAEDDLKFRCFFEVLYFCGLRRGEARALQWNDIDFVDEELRVNKNCITIGSESSDNYQLTSPKTQSSNRLIPIPSTLIEDLKKLQQEDKRRYGFKNTWFVFGTDVPLKNSKLRLRKNLIAEKAGLRQIKIHDFRHSCASLLINNGANITMVAKYLGHTKIDETLNTYSHMYKSKLNDIVGTINQLY
ncbi:MAG: site-specific integrase [Tenericutes bacterium]|nr:site-specific integrase [Mycoplasmatota bacterium]MDD6942159.1 site-specific integrase [bacterium]MDY2697101.1 site-specific integrase [Bacilli bacterium]